MNYVLYAIPFFFLLIGLELLAERWRGTQYYRVNDAISSLSAGVLSQMIGLVKKLIPFTIYVLIFDAVAVFEWPQGSLFWLLAFVLYDFCYYWNHRFGHEVNLFWAAHVVHHSSEEYNLSTALRQTSGSLLSWIFYLPLAILGVDPYTLISVGSLNLIYQFWVHTRHVPKLGWFEWFFVSPSNHRVHHAQNQIYLDRNYGGVFIIWDRLFGSFQEELDDEPPIYGVRKPLHSWNPVWANLQVYQQLWLDAWHAERWWDKLRVWFMRTGWRPADVAERFPLPVCDLSQFQKFDTPLSTLGKLYAILQHGLTIAIALLVLLNTQMPTWQQLAVIGFVVFASYSLSLVLEGKPQGLVAELSKLVLILAVTLSVGLSHWFAMTLVLLASVSLWVLWRLSQQKLTPMNDPVAN